MSKTITKNNFHKHFPVIATYLHPVKEIRKTRAKKDFYIDYPVHFFSGGEVIFLRLETANEFLKVWASIVPFDHYDEDSNEYTEGWEIDNTHTVRNHCFDGCDVSFMKAALTLNDELCFKFTGDMDYEVFECLEKELHSLQFSKSLKKVVG